MFEEAHNYATYAVISGVTGWALIEYARARMKANACVSFIENLVQSEIKKLGEEGKEEESEEVQKMYQIKQLMKQTNCKRLIANPFPMKEARRIIGTYDFTQRNTYREITDLMQRSGLQS